MKLDRLTRFVERQMMGNLFKQNKYHDFPDWVWEAIFELFTHE